MTSSWRKEMSRQFRGLQSSCQGRGSRLDPQNISTSLSPVGNNSPTSGREKRQKQLPVDLPMPASLAASLVTFPVEYERKITNTKTPASFVTKIPDFVSFVERRPLPTPRLIADSIGGPAACSIHGIVGIIPRAPALSLTRDGEETLANQRPRQNEWPSSSRLGVHPRLACK